MTKRDTSIDSIKGFCVLLVVIGHFSPDGAPQWFLSLRSFIYTFHMPVFMALSGILFMKTRKTDQLLKSFYRSKFRRLIIPYFCLSILIIVNKLIAAKFITLENPVQPLALIRMIYFPEAGFFLWFVYSLFIIFLIVGLACKFSKGLPALGILSIIMYFAPIQLPKELCINEIKSTLVYFMLGCAIQRYINSPFLKSSGLSIFLLLSHIVLFAISDQSNMLVRKLISFTMASCAIVYLLSLFYSKYVHFPPELGYYGTSIYLFHTMSMAPAKYFMMKMVGVSSSPKYLLSAVFVDCIGVFVPIMFAKYVLHKSDWASRLLLGERWDGIRTVWMRS